MKLDTFTHHLDRYGAEPDRWPGAARKQAEALLATSAEAVRALAEARQLAARLQHLPDRNASADLAARIAAQAVAETRQPQIPGWGLPDRFGDWFGRALWRPALAAALPLALGFALGFSNPQAPEADDAYLLETLGMLPFSQNFEELPDAQ